jgi:hypothetical protein
VTSITGRRKRKTEKALFRFSKVKNVLEVSICGTWRNAQEKQGYNSSEIEMKVAPCNIEISV